MSADIVKTLRDRCLIRHGTSERLLACVDCRAAEEITRLRARVEDLERAASSLVDRLDDMHEPVESLAIFAGIHGSPYEGPSWKEPLEALRTLTNQEEDDG